MVQQSELRLVRHRYRCPRGHAHWERRETEFDCLTCATRGLADPQFERVLDLTEFYPDHVPN